MSKKVLIDCRLYNKSNSGIKRYIRNVLLTFSNLNVSTYQIDLLIGNDFDNDILNKLLYSPSIKKTILSPFNPLHVLILSIKLYFNNEYALHYWTIYSGTIFKRSSVRQVSVVHDLMFNKIKNYFSSIPVINSFKKFILLFIVNRTLITSDIILTVSETSKTDIFEKFKKIAIVIPLGMSLGRGEKKISENLKNKYGEYYLYVGSSRMQKNLQFLMCEFDESLSKKKLLVCGVDSLDLSKFSDKIISIGIVSDTFLEELYSNAFCFVFPSLYEGFGLPILESYYYVNRILSSDRGALSEFSFLGINYFNPYEKGSLKMYFDNECSINETIKNIDISIYDWDRHNNILGFILKKLM